MSMVPRATSAIVDPTQQLEQMSGMISEMIVSQGQNARATLEVINTANQQKIDALKAQVAAMEKTVAASQKALAESKARCVEKRLLCEAHRQARKVELDALQAEYRQHLKRFEQFEPMFEKMDQRINGELLKIRAGKDVATLDRWGSRSADPRNPWNDSRGPVGYVGNRYETYLDGKQFVDKYSGATFKKQINDLFVKNGQQAPFSGC